VALLVILGVSLLYQKELFDASEDVIKSVQEGNESWIPFFYFVSKTTSGGAYGLYVLFLIPFISRERFWYYFAAAQLQSCLVAVLKFSFHDPRPTFIWTGLSEEGCSSSWGNPSGHAMECINFALIILLDNIFASEWSRRTYPHLNTMSLKKDPCVFGGLLLFLFIYWPLVTFDRIYLGKHALNQVFLGNQIGIWLALFLHFVVRDTIWNHYSNITEKKLSGTQVLCYLATASAIVISGFALISLYMYILGATVDIPQVWLETLTKNCDDKVDFEVDAEGKYVADMGFFFYDNILLFTFYFFILGLYFGQLLVSWKNIRIPDFGQPCPGCKCLISLIGLLIGGLALGLQDKAKDNFELWTVIILFGCIPMFLAGTALLFTETFLIKRCSEHDPNDDDESVQTPNQNVPQTEPSHEIDDAEILKPKTKSAGTSIQ